MEFLSRPILRVPLVLAALGLLYRFMSFAGGLIWGAVLRARGPGPDGVFQITSGPVMEIVAVLSCLLFWLAGWRFIRGLPRRTVFGSASIMVAVNAALLAAEQISQHLFGVYSLGVYRLYALTEGKAWVDQLFLRLFLAAGVESSLWVLPGLFAPYLYLFFAKKDAPAERGRLV